MSKIKTKKTGRKITKRTRKIESRPLRAEKKQGIFNRIKWGESYASFILGLVVVIVSFVLIMSFVRDTKTVTGEKQTSSTSTTEASQDNVKSEKNAGADTLPVLPKVYTAKDGDTLWSIAEKFYNSGYNWVDIARENNLENPELIHAGNKLTIPNVKPIVLQSDLSLQKTEKGGQTLSISNIAGDTYTVVKGDNLWDISLRAYGDGFRWTEIAKVNHLVNPNLIHSGNVFKIPQ